MSAQILIVDDAPDVLLIAQMELRRLQWRNQPIQITTASSGSEAVETVRKKDFDVVIMDIVMETDHAGLEALLSLREIQPHLIHIVHTGQAGRLTSEEAILRYPVDYYLHKGDRRLYETTLLALRQAERYRHRETASSLSL